MDTAAQQAAWRREQLNYALPVRAVYDREVGTFSHDINSLRQNSFATTTVSSGFEVGLVSKARNYSATEFDILQTMLDNERSNIHEMDIQDVRDFFALTSDIYKYMSDMSGRSIVIGLNQHPEGFRIPERDRLGNKQRVQTLQPLHVHVYEASIISENKVTMRDLPIADQRDMSDPFLLLSSSIMMNRLKSDALFEDFSIAMGDPLIPPWGLNIKIEKPLIEFLKDQIEVLVELQRVVFAEYNFWSAVIRSPGNNHENILKAGNTLPAPTLRRLELLASSLQPEEAVGGIEYLFTNGCAITYTLLEDACGHTVINVHPRLMSKGNSADSMGIYVDNFEGERAHELEAKRLFYRRLIARIAANRVIKEGAFLTGGDE